MESETVIIKQSSLHGYGVFAKVDIPIGSVITYYDGKLLPNIALHDLGDHPEINDDDLYFMITHSRNVIRHHTNSNNIEVFELLNEAVVKSKESIYGYNYNDLIELNSNKIGSLINDGLWNNDIKAYSDALGFTDIKKNKSIEETLKMSYTADGFLKLKSDKVNCCFKRECIPRGVCGKLFTDKIDQYAIIAIRDIKIGEEILMSYGMSYWCEEYAYRTYFVDIDSFLKLVNKKRYEMGKIRKCLQLFKKDLLSKTQKN